VLKVATLPTSITQRYAYDESSHLIGEYGATTRDYIWLDDLPVAVADTRLVGGLSLHFVTTINYVHADGLGTPRAVTDSTGNTIWSWPYQGNPFGELQPTSTNGYTLNLRYPGQYFDAESGLVDNGFRTYEAATGRYGQSDPAGLNGGISTYAYAGGNSLSLVDPLGLQVNEGGGTTVCDGHGGFKIINNDHSVTRQCTQQHEQSHVDDLKKWAPNVCKGAPENYPPGPDVDQMSREPYSSVPSYPLQRSECAAYRKSLQCDSKCPGATPQVERDLNQLHRYQCDAWGW
jgi:RHS repeat-associated protein